MSAPEIIFRIIIFFISLLILVILHELGHFILAKRFGIKVLEFGFGIPPRAWGKKIGETVYSLNWLPLGGFVKLLGEDEEEVLSVKKGLNSGDFRAKPVSQRIMVVVAGVVMNLVLAWILFYIVIISQNFKIIYPTLEPAVYIAEVEEGFPAKQAGVKTGEQLVAVDGQQVSKIEDARNLIRSKDGTPVILTLADSDGNNPRKINVTPKKVDSKDALIGVVFSPIPFREYTTFGQKLFSGITYSWDLVRLTFQGFGKLFEDLLQGNLAKASQSFAGPVGMAGVANDILSLGWEAILPYLWFVGLISLTLAVFNVLPIPALDGGRLLFLVIEAVARKKVNENTERWVHQIGFALLIALAVLITYSDIRKLIP